MSRAFNFHSRWLVLAMILAALATILHVYIFYVVSAVYVTFVIVRNKISVRALFGNIPSGYNWWPLMLMVIGILAYSAGASVVVMYPLVQLDAEYFNDLMSSNMLSESAVSSFILLVLLAPMFEEMVFRGLLFTRLTKKWGMNMAMVISSLFFGLMHFPLNPIGAALVGVVACVLYVRTRTLWVPIALHALNNMIAWSLMFAPGGGAVDFASSEFLAQFAYEGLIAMMLGAPMVFFLLGRWWLQSETPIPYSANLEMVQGGSDPAATESPLSTTGDADYPRNPSG